MMGVADDLRRALENLVRNAIRHTEMQSEGQITMRRQEAKPTAKAVVQVRDHGPGVPDSDLQKIFSPSPIEFLSTVLSRAFHSEPHFTYIMPDEQVRRMVVPWFVRSVAIRASQPLRSIHRAVVRSSSRGLRKA